MKREINGKMGTQVEDKTLDTGQNPGHGTKPWTRFDFFVLTQTLNTYFPEVSFEAQECKITECERKNKSNRVQGFVFDLSCSLFVPIN